MYHDTFAALLAGTLRLFPSAFLCQTHSACVNIWSCAEDQGASSGWLQEQGLTRVVRGCRGRSVWLGAASWVLASACVAPPGPRGSVHGHASGHSSQDLVFVSKQSRLPSCKSPQTFRDSSGTNSLVHGKRTKSPRGVCGPLCRRGRGANRILSRRSRMSTCSGDAKGNRPGGQAAAGGGHSVRLPHGRGPNWNVRTWGGGRLKLQGLVTTTEPESQQGPEVATAWFRTRLPVLRPSWGLGRGRAG